ncbi:DoxX family protein [Naasia lichenicola]|uniref:DoxX family protein n=1 Tax=Naasia lichenicola TaxID=2565933 RepID=UPI001E5367E6|nr:hypothetical protein [Naasia lichenicola]
MSERSGTARPSTARGRLTERRFSPRRIARVALGVFLLAAGISHWTLLRQAFQAQVPPWLPLDPDFVVLASGVVEMLLGLALLAVGLRPLRRFAVPLGWLVALFFVLVFPGNISQLVVQIQSEGAGSATGLWVRLIFQPLLVLWALWSTAAWAWLVWWRAQRRAEAV